MTRPALICAVAFLVIPLEIGTAGPTRAEPPHGNGRRSLGGLLTVYYAPIEDTGRGRLYGALGNLLTAARELPEAIALPPPSEPAAPPASSVAKAAAGQQPLEQPAPRARRTEPADGRPGWMSVVSEPVLPDEDLAHAYFEARKFEQAAEVYRFLHERAPENRHWLLFLFLCERNLGNAQEAATLLGKLAGSDADSAEWAAWIADVDTLATTDEASETP